MAVAWAALRGPVFGCHWRLVMGSVQRLSTALAPGGAGGCGAPAAAGAAGPALAEHRGGGSSGGGRGARGSGAPQIQPGVASQGGPPGGGVWVPPAGCTLRAGCRVAGAIGVRPLGEVGTRRFAFVRLGGEGGVWRPGGWRATCKQGGRVVQRRNQRRQRSSAWLGARQAHGAGVRIQLWAQCLGLWQTALASGVLRHVCSSGEPGEGHSSPRGPAHTHAQGPALGSPS